LKIAVIVSDTNLLTLVVLDELNPARHPIIKQCCQNNRSVELVHVRTLVDAIIVCQKQRVDCVVVAAKLEAHSGLAAAQKLLAQFPRLSIFVVQESLSLGVSSDHDPVHLVQTLSWRERQVFEMVVEGKSSGEIAQLLGLSSKTVDTYRSRLMQKLRADDLPSLVRLAIRAGVSSLEMV
jgi:DNA-binding NarL/FixJ family response regulator